MKLVNECYWWLTEIMLISYLWLHSFLVKKASQEHMTEKTQSPSESSQETYPELQAMAALGFEHRASVPFPNHVTSRILRVIEDAGGWHSTF